MRAVGVSRFAYRRRRLARAHRAVLEKKRPARAPRTWRDKVDAAVDELAARHVDDALAEEVFARIAETAAARRHTERVRSALVRDPYGELGPFAQPLAACVVVQSLERTWTRSESAVASVLDVRGRALRCAYEARGGTLRFTATLAARDPARPPATILDFRSFCQSPKRPQLRCAPGGCRALVHALGVPLGDVVQVAFFLLSMLPLYDNEFDLDEGVLAALGVLDDGDASDDAPGDG